MAYTSVSYKKLLRNPKWVEFTEKMKDLRDWKCEECGECEKSLQSHHTKYLPNRKPWQYNESLIQVLCNECHEKKHEHEISIKKEIENARKFLNSLVKDLFCESCFYMYEKFEHIEIGCSCNLDFPEIKLALLRFQTEKGLLD